MDMSHGKVGRWRNEGNLGLGIYIHVHEKWKGGKWRNEGKAWTHTHTQEMER